MAEVNVFRYGETDFIEQTQPLNGKDYQLSPFDTLVHESWNEAMDKGFIRYGLDSVRSRVLPGKYGYFVELNTKRGHERRKPEYISTLQMPFDPDRFNFTKVKAGEIICEFYSQDEAEQDKSSLLRNVILVNVSPLAYGHILLVTHVDQGIPQKLTQAAVRQCLAMILLSSHPGFRIGFNSLCALASVNHQHVHAWYLDQSVYTEKAPVKSLYKDVVYETTDLPLNAVVFQLHGTSMEVLAQRVFKVLNLLQESEVAHNMFITRGQTFEASDVQTVRVYIWPRKKTIGVKNETIVPFNIATVELGGQVPVFVADMFDDLTEEDIVDRIKPHALPEDEKEQIRENIVQLFSC